VTRDRSRTARPDLARGRAKRERRLLRVALQRPELLPPEWAELAEDDFSHPTARALVAAIVEAGGVDAPFDAVLTAAPDDDVRQVLQQVAMEDFEFEPSEDAVTEEVRVMLAERVEAEMAAVRAELELVNMDVEPERGRELTGRLFGLEQRKRELRGIDGG
jgi:DNA primase